MMALDILKETLNNSTTDETVLNYIVTILDEGIFWNIKRRIHDWKEM
jgi:hypothetical protein